LAIGLMQRIDRLVESSRPSELDGHLLALRDEIEEVNRSTVCEKEELDLPVSGMPVKLVQTVGLLIEDTLGSLRRRIGLNGKTAAVSEQERSLP
jgi:hypothetical protein